MFAEADKLDVGDNSRLTAILIVYTTLHLHFDA
jgi:hypothetical protein